MSNLNGRFSNLSLASSSRHTPTSSSLNPLRTKSTSPPSYNVLQPAAMASRQGHIIHNPKFSSSASNSSQQNLYGFSSNSMSNRSSPKVPAIPQSQEVKQFIKEPSYSTLLQLERDAQLNKLRQQQQQQQLQQHYHSAAQAGRSPAPHQLCQSGGDVSIYANYAALSTSSYYSELEALKSTDSQDQDYSAHHQQLVYNSPPSPVSSSYSELKQATKLPPGYYLQQMQKQQQLLAAGSKNYESLYEPVQEQQKSPENFRNPQQYETVGNNSESSDYFGMCFKCQKKIVGEGTGCSAMGRLYHILCFTCHHCEELLQGKPFYALDGKPFCQQDYLNTLEKCCKCLTPIRDRILRATGKPYHPKCFMCIVCRRSLDGVPFTVDATNNIHCIACFHNEFAPKCSVCLKPIKPEPGQEECVRVVALDRSFHVNCYRCEDCNVQLSSEEEGSGCYPLDGHTLCKLCNTKRIQDLTNGI